MKEIIVATGNQNKMKEIREILRGIPYEVKSLKDVGFCRDMEENGTTFEENSLIKAREVAKYYPDAIVLADDSGLEIDYLHKEPGVYSARFGGADTSYDIKNQVLIDLLRNAEEEERNARFVCVISIVLPDGREAVVKGTMEGRIAYEKAGDNGFGYDPIFFLPEYGCTSAQLSSEEKNRISHRGCALEALKKRLGEMLK